MGLYEVCYAVIFSSRVSGNTQGYDEMSKLIESIVADQSGYIDHKSFSATDGERLTISYWKTLDDIKQWKENVMHKKAKELGKNQWYTYFNIKIAKVEKQYEWKQVS